MSFTSAFHFQQMLLADQLAQSQASALLAVSGSNTGSFNAMIASRVASEAAATSASIASANWTGYARNQFDPPPWVETLNSSSIWGH